MDAQEFRAGTVFEQRGTVAPGGVPVQPQHLVEIAQPDGLEVHQAADGQALFHQVPGTPGIQRRPVGGRHHPHQVSARGMAADDDPGRIAAVFRRMIPYPDKGSPALGDEFVHVHFGDEGIVNDDRERVHAREGVDHVAELVLAERLPVAPVEEHVDRRGDTVRPGISRAEDVQGFRRRGPVGHIRRPRQFLPGFPAPPGVPGQVFREIRHLVPVVVFGIKTVPVELAEHPRRRHGRPGPAGPVGPEPFQPLVGVPGGQVFRADPTVIVQPRELPEQPGVVDLALRRFMPSRHPRHLHVTDPGQRLGQPLQQVPLGHLHVVAVENQANVPDALLRFQPVHEVDGLGDPEQRIVRPVGPVDGLDQDLDPRGARNPRGPGKVIVHPVQGDPAVLADAGHGVNPGGADPAGIVDGAADTLPGFPFTPRHGAQAEIAGVGVSRRGVQYEHFHPRGVECLQQPPGPGVMGPVAFHGAEARLRGGMHALRQGAVGPEVCEVGGKPERGHRRYQVLTCFDTTQGSTRALKSRKCPDLELKWIPRVDTN